LENIYEVILNIEHNSIYLLSMNISYFRLEILLTTLAITGMDTLKEEI